MVRTRGPEILWWRTVCPASSIALYSSSASIAYPLHAKKYFLLLSEFIGYYAGLSRYQDNEGDLTVSLATAWHVKFGELGLRSQGIKLFTGDPPVLANCVVSIPKCLDGVPLTAEVVTYPVATLSPFSRPICLRGL